MVPVMKLARALTDEVEGGFQITLQMESGLIVRIFATEDQLADLADDFDELLDLDDAEADEDQDDAGQNQPS